MLPSGIGLGCAATCCLSDCHSHTPCVQVTIACLWAACFNKLLLPWSSRDWALEQISGALVSGSGVLRMTSALQFAAAAPASVPQPAGSGDSSNSSGTQPPRSQLAAALLDQEAVLQKCVVEPMVAVQTGEAACWMLLTAACSHQPVAFPCSCAPQQQEAADVCACTSFTNNVCVRAFACCRAALSLETHVFGQRSAPQTLPKALKTLVREMLLMADRLTAVQVAVAALPQASAGNNASDSAVVQDRLQQVATSDAERSLQFVIGVLMQPLHKSHVLQMELVAAVAAAVKEVLLEPSAEAKERLRHCLSQLEWERARGSSLVASLRKQLHHDVMKVHTGGADGAVWQQQSATPAEDAEQHLVCCVTAAMNNGDVLAVVGDGSGVSADAAAQHVSRWWWQHAGDFYCQCLAFQYAFDSAVAGFLAVAATALRL